MIRFDCICFLIICEEQERNNFAYKVWKTEIFFNKCFQSILVLLLNFSEGFSFLNVGMAENIYNGVDNMLATITVKSKSDLFCLLL